MLRIMIGAAVVASALMGTAQADNYPSRPIRLIVPFAAGGGTDALARFLAKGIEGKLGQPIVIENKPGSGTTIGATFVARSAPDGYTLLMATASTFAFAPGFYKNLAYDPVADFSPITMIAEIPFILTANPTLPAANLKEFIELARAQRGAMSYASAGAGSVHHISMELLKSLAGIDLKHVAYRGGGPAQQDVVAGHVPVMFADIGPAAELIRAGKLKTYGVTTRQRAAILPDVPTIEQAGVPGFESNTWQCVVGPAKLPEAIVMKLNKALVDFVATPEAQSHLLRLGMTPGTSTPAAQAAHIKAELVRWGKVVKGIGPIE